MRRQEVVFSFRRLVLAAGALLALGCGGGGGGSNDTTPPPSPPTISSFSASPLTVTTGSSSTLSWNVTGATSLSINQGVGAVTGTSTTVSPSSTTTYALTATNTGGSVSANATVTVVPLPAIASFTANPSSVSAGQSSTLSWSVTGAVSLAIDHGVGTVTGASTSVNPVATTTYTLTATNAAGASVTGTATVTVTGVGVSLTPGNSSQAQVTSGGSILNFAFPANVVSQTASGSFTALTGAPVSLGSAQGFTPDPNNLFVVGFTFTINPASITTFNVPVPIAGSVTLSSSITPGTTLNLAMLQSGVWADVATFVVGSGGTFTEDIPSYLLPGFIAPGTYVVYKPVNSTAVSNLGIALIADDGMGSGPAQSALQVVNLFDAGGSPLPTPTIHYLAFLPTAYDLDGEALTPDGSQGIMVDGGNTLRFFSQVQTGTPIASATTLDIGAYGGDGDSVAIMPNGDEAVVSGDSSSQLVIVSGIKSGNPNFAEVIPIPNNRDGLVISGDGKVMLARGSSGLTVFNISAVSPAPGSLGGTLSHHFTQTADLSSLGASNEDGRDGMAISPQDSGRAVVVNPGATVTLLTGLPSTPVISSITLTGAFTIFSVSISPDGKTAICGTEAGLAMVSGINTGTLAQVGAIFAPTYTAANSSTQTLGYVPTLGITLDGKYVVVCSPNNFSFSDGTLLVIPFSASGFSAPVGQLNGIAVPANDQLVLH